MLGKKTNNKYSKTENDEENVQKNETFKRKKVQRDCRRKSI